MEKTYNVGVIGFGFIGKVHAYCYESLKYYFEPNAFIKIKLLGVCTSKKETAEKAKEYGFTFATMDYKELINHQDIDIVNICSPNIFHKNQLLEAIKADKHIYCEKPLVCNNQEADEIEKALKKYSKIHQVTFHIRFYPAIIKTKEIIDEGLLGEIISFRIAYYHSGSIEPNKPIGWKQEKKMGGGVLLDLGSHAIDFAYFIFGKFEEVSGVSKILYPERIDRTGKKVRVETEDYAIINAKMKNNSLGVIEVSKIATGSQDEFKFEIYGTKGALRHNSMEPNFLEFYDQNEPDEPSGGMAGFKKIVTVNRYPKPSLSFPGPKFSGGWLSGHIHCLGNFLQCIKENKKAIPSFYDGLYNGRVIENIQRSFSK